MSGILDTLLEELGVFCSEGDVVRNGVRAASSEQDRKGTFKMLIDVLQSEEQSRKTRGDLDPRSERCGGPSSLFQPQTTRADRLPHSSQPHATRVRSITSSPSEPPGHHDQLPLPVMDLVETDQSSGALDTRHATDPPHADLRFRSKPHHGQMEMLRGDTDGGEGGGLVSRNTVSVASEECHSSFRTEREEMNSARFSDQKNVLESSTQLLDGNSSEMANVHETTSFSEPSSLTSDREASLKIHIDHHYAEPQISRSGYAVNPRLGLPLAGMEKLSRRKQKALDKRRESELGGQIKDLEFPLRRAKRKHVVRRVRAFDRRVGAQVRRREAIGTEETLSDHHYERVQAHHEPVVKLSKKARKKKFRAAQLEEEKKEEKREKKKKRKEENKEKDRKRALQNRIRKQEREAAVMEKQQKALEVREMKSQHRAEMIRKSALNIILGDENREEDADFTAEEVMHGIRSRINDNPEMVLQGRGRGSTRIDYWPEARDITSIHSRISNAQARGVSLGKTGKMLEPLIAWNRSAFMEIPDHVFDQYALTCTTVDAQRYASQWRLHRRCLKEIRLMDWNQRDLIVDSVLASVRRRVHVDSPLLDEAAGAERDHEMRLNPKKWSLGGRTKGLGEKLGKCFEEDGLSPEEYEDRIEACLYRFKMANKEAVRSY